MKTKKTKSHKGALIKGMFLRKPAVLFDEPLFEKNLKKLMKGRSGIYALYKGSKLYYVGLTKNLHGRIKWHYLGDRLAGKWDNFSIFIVNRVGYLKDLETMIQNIFETKGNRATGRVPKKYGLDYIINRILKDKKRDIEKLERSIS